jgi:hypothetical protein
MTKHVSPKEGGFALLLALIISSVALSIGLALLDITVKQLSLGTTARESEVAFQVAATAMNCLQFARNTDYNRSQTDGGAGFSIDCVGMRFAFNDANPTDRIIRYTNGTGNDLTMSGAVRCVQYDMYVLLATGGQNVTMLDPNNSDRTISCDGSLGDNFCTYAYARGHNRSCTDVANANLFVVQRELTAEF